MSRAPKRLATLAVAGVLASSFAAPAAFGTGDGDGGGNGHKKKCNAGRGNGSEGCDPGNSSTAFDGSAGQNQGGDEGGPIHGGTGAP